MSPRRLADLVTVSAAVVVFAFALGLVAAEPAAALPDKVDIHIRYSHFEPSSIAVPFGRPVTFVLHNDDPIEHEWIVGDAALHERHRTGTEEHHGERSTEVSIAASSVIETTVTFDQPVEWSYVCHLPGHEAYGMVGLLVAR